jgi:hypothetical protein
MEVAMANREPRLTDLGKLTYDDLRWEGAANFPIRQGWNVSVEIFFADDLAAAILNGNTVLTVNFGESGKRVDLQNILQNGDNTLRMVCHNIHPPRWTFRYRIGVFDENGRPQYDAIDITAKGETPHLGPQYDVIYSFPKS